MARSEERKHFKIYTYCVWPPKEKNKAQLRGQCAQDGSSTVGLFIAELERKFSESLESIEKMLSFLVVVLKSDNIHLIHDCNKVIHYRFLNKTAM